MATQADIYETITSTVIEQLDAGVAPWKRGWDPAVGRPRNIRGTAYRGINILLLTLQAGAKGYGSPVWLTFKQAQSLGGSVRKGEKGTKVTLWKPITKKGQDENGEDETRKFLLLRQYTVFNSEQCDGIEIPKAAQAVDPITSAEDIVAGYENGPSVRVSHDGRACYGPNGDVVAVPAREAFETSEGYYSTLFHELGHSTGHATRLARKGIIDFDAFGSHQYAQEELVAEFAATFLCATAGITRSDEIENSAAYLKHWKQVLKDDPKILIFAAAQAQKAADRVLGIEAPAKQVEVKKAA